MSVPPLFILASPRSFTSVSCAMLGQHPNAYGVPELNLFIADTLGQMIRRLKRRNRMFQLHGLLRMVSQLYAGEQTLYSVEMAHRWIARRLDWTVGEVYQELGDRVSPLQIVDKSPVYSSTRVILNRLHRTFPDAYYLHLVRHPVTQGRSLLSVRGGRMMATHANSIDYSTNPPTIDPQYAWYRVQKTILNFLSQIPLERQMRLQGENLINQPEIHLEKICRWLNWSWDDAVLEAMLRPQDSAYATFGPYGARLGNDPNFLSSPMFRPQQVEFPSLVRTLPWRDDGVGLMPEAIALAQELGYN